MEDSRILWDAVKGFIRSNTTLFASNLRKAEAAKLENLENTFSCLDAALSAGYSEDLAVQHDLIKKEINALLKKRSEFLIHRSRQRYYFQGSRPSHLLAMKIKSNEQFADIASIQTENGDITTDPIHINERFKNYYSDLYRSDIDLDKVRCDAFLSISLSYQRKVLLTYRMRYLWEN